MISKVPITVSLANGQSTPDYFQAFTNYMNIQCKIHSDRPLARYFVDNGFDALTYSQVDCIATNLACKWAKEEVKSIEVVSFLGDHNVGYLITMLALLKLRVTMMAISPRNSEAADINLLENTQSKLLIASSKYEDIAKAAAAKVPGVKVITVDDLDINTLVEEPLNPEHVNLLDYKFSDDDLSKSALIIHSSGSTSFPKPIYLSNRYLFNIIKCFHIQINDKEGAEEKFGVSDSFLTCTPLYHILGFFAAYSMASVGGSVVFLGKLPPSQEDIDFALEYNKCTSLCATPIILEQMIPYLERKKEYTNVKRLKVAICGGAPLKRESGDWLKNHGLNVCNVYGTTEVGAAMTSNLVDRNNKHWYSISPYQMDHQGKSYFVFEVNDEATPEVKHLYVRGDSPSMATGISNRPDGGYDTNDLFVENPECPGYFVYLGRRDDTLIMENGEKTNPVPMESTIRQSRMVMQVVVLGHERQCTAALIELDTEYAMKFSPDEIISAVQVAIKEANKECPNHSKIFPKMVKILPFDKVLPSTDKGTVIRKKAEAMYKDYVEKLYKGFLEGPPRDSADTNNMDTSTWTAKQTEDFLIDCAAGVLEISKSSFKDKTQSIFDLGLNSLSAIQLRNCIAECFNGLAQNFLFQNPSITSMRETLMSSKDKSPAEIIEKRYQQTQDLAQAYIEKAKLNFPVAENNYDEKRAKVVLLTGVTGSLGSFMLQDLLKDPSVKKVYCLVRGRQEKLQDRLRNAFESRELDVSLLHTDRVEVLPLRFSDSFLGFTEEKYNQLKNEVTIVQHCAWLLDFNMPIDHYDKECIAPFYNLLQFAYHPVNPMHVHFVSSVSASAAWDSEIPEEPLPFDSRICMPMGYAHSKFVIEQLLNYLTAEKNFPCYIERLGQVCGDSRNGVWNISEQYPLLFIGGASVMHKMPDLGTVIDWITVDYASASIADIMLRTAYFSANKREYIYHIVNPSVIYWDDVLQAMKDAGMNFDIISPLEWVKELSKDDTNPSYKLISFFTDNFKEAFKMPIWQTKKTSALTPIIARSYILDSNLFGKFLKHWESVGFYSPLI